MRLPPLRVLLLDDLGAEAGALAPLRRALEAAGVEARSPRLGGEAHLVHTRWLDWMGTARRAFGALTEGDERALIIGAGVGALLAFALAHERGARVAGVAMIAAPLQPRRATAALLRVVGRPSLRALLPQRTTAALAALRPDPLLSLPLSVALEVPVGQAIAWDRADRVRSPTLLLHGQDDARTRVTSAKAFFEALKAPRRGFKVYPKADHRLLGGAAGAQVLEDLMVFSRAPEAL